MPKVTATVNVTIEIIVAGLNVGGGALTVTVVAVEFTAVPVASVT